MIPAVLVTHGSLGYELIRTAEAIIGSRDGVAAVSNADLSLELLAGRVEEAVQSFQGPVLLLADLPGSSCSHACIQVKRRHSRTAVLTGVNLPLLMDYFHNRESEDLIALVERLLDRGRRGIQCL